MICFLAAGFGLEAESLRAGLFKTPGTPAVEVGGGQGPTPAAPTASFHLAKGLRFLFTVLQRPPESS